MYILRSDVTDKLYTGITNRLPFRVRMHNTGRGARFTRTGAPWRIVYVQPMASMSEALKTERRIKRMKRSEKLRLFEPTAGSPSR